MAEYANLLDYSIEKGVFRGTVKLEHTKTVPTVTLKNIRLNEDYTAVACAGTGEPDIYRFEADVDNEKFAGGTWYPVISAGDEELLLKYRDMENDKEVGRLVELSEEKLYFNPVNKTHYMGALDKDSIFVIRKWKYKSTGIKRTPVIVEEYSVDGKKAEFTLRNSFEKNIEQSEVWLWSRSLKLFKRISQGVCRTGEKKFTIDFSEFDNIDGNQVGKLWEVHLMLNLDGTFCQGRIEIRAKDAGKRDYVQKTGADESERYLISEPVRKQDKSFDSAEQVYFDKLSRLCCKIVSRDMMYKGMYRAEAKDFSVKKGVFNIMIDFPVDGFANRRIKLRHYSETQDKVTEYDFSGDGDYYTLNYRDVEWESLRYEIIFLADKDDYTYEFRVVSGSERFVKKMSNVYKYYHKTDDGCIIYLTETMGGMLVLEYRKKSAYDSFRYRVNERLALMAAPAVKLCFRKRNVMMFYEKFCTAAQDNSYYMFEYFVEKNDKKMKPRYVIEKKQRDYKALKGKYGWKVVPFMSVRHLIDVQIARMFISTDSKRHCYRWRAGNTPVMRKLSEKPFVFLQHGVLGFKRVENIYGSQYANKADLFVTSSDFERDIVERVFGYDKREIIVTGLARWDKLENNTQKKPFIFYMPTWRNWIYETSAEEFVKTDYYKIYSEILSSDRLVRTLEKNDMEMIFCLHPKFRQFSKELKSAGDRVKVVDFADCHINELLMKCSMFITDYSSASWDIFYLGKPVIFYQFDAEEYVKKQGAYINLEKELFGYRVTDFDSLLDKISYIANTSFKDNENSDSLREKYLPLRDKKNRERIYTEIINRGNKWLI
ncbi:MAG: hypothetical protein HFH14_06625 [Lachnospiraceae bacterium]|nr:hypothetical protein [Lachnospiraceae bacterium]